MSALGLREQLRVAKAIRVGMEIEPGEVPAILEDMEADHQALLELSSDIAALSERLRLLRRDAVRASVFIALLIGGLHVVFAGL